jgi:hypothetical protein
MKLIYDIETAKVGDKCFDVRLGKCEITSIQIDKHGITLWLSGDRDKCQVHSSYPPDLEPLLFTSKEAFDLYWFEKTKITGKKEERILDDKGKMIEKKIVDDPTAKPRIDPLTGDTIPVPVAGFGEKLARHFTFQTEVLISKNIHFRVAFDYHKRQEMKVVARPGFSGFSFGLGMYFKRFSLDYGFLIHSVAGYTNGFTLTTNLDKWKR